MAMKEFNSYMDIQDENGDIERHYPITKAENVIGLNGVGLSPQQRAALALMASNAYIVDDTTGELYKIGSSDGKFYFDKADDDIKDILNTITNALEDLGVGTGDTTERK